MVSTVVYTQNGLGVGSEGDDHIIGRNADNDTIVGNGGNDLLDGGGSDDRIYGGSGNDRILGGKGNDILRGDAGSDFLDGGDGNDLMHGGDGNDQLWGGAGKDELRGGSGDDLLWGGSGSDVLVGGSGADRFLFKASDAVVTGSATVSVDKVLDLNFGENDSIQLEGFTVLDSFWASFGGHHVIQTAEQMSSLVDYLAAENKKDVVIGNGGQNNVLLKLHVGDDVQVLELHNFSHWYTGNLVA